MTIITNPLTGETLNHFGDKPAGKGGGAGGGGISSQREHKKQTRKLAGDITSGMGKGTFSIETNTKGNSTIRFGSSKQLDKALSTKTAKNPPKGIKIDSYKDPRKGFRDFDLYIERS